MATLSGKIAVVSGASRGLGAEMSLELARRGAAVRLRIMLLYTSDSSSARVEELAKQIKSFDGHPDARGCKCDLRKPEGPEAVTAALDAWLGPDGSVDILVNNAGFEIQRRLGEIAVADYEAVYDVNVRGTILLTQQLLPRFSPAGHGRIVNIGSVGGRGGFAGRSLYCSSKAALEGLTRCWAAELGVNGTTVNQVNPGPVQSDMLDGIPKHVVEAQKKATPIRNRVGTPNEIARIVAWLAGPDSAWVSGQVISASGGLAMY